jgi:hypothetical protein
MEFFFYSRLGILSSLMKKSARQPGVRFFLEKIGKSVQSSDLIKNIHLVFFSTSSTQTHTTRQNKHQLYS